MYLIMHVCPSVVTMFVVHCPSTVVYICTRVLTHPTGFLLHSQCLITQAVKSPLVETVFSLQSKYVETIRQPSY